MGLGLQCIFLNNSVQGSYAKTPVNPLWQGRFKTLRHSILRQQLDSIAKKSIEKFPT